MKHTPHHPTHRTEPNPEQALQSVSPAIFAALQARFDAPAQPNNRLYKTMRTQPPWYTPTP